MRKGDRVVYLLGAGSYEGIRGRVLQLLPGDRARVELADGYKVIEGVDAFGCCPPARRKAGRRRARSVGATRRGMERVRAGAPR